MTHSKNHTHTERRGGVLASVSLLEAAPAPAAVAQTANNFRPAATSDLWCYWSTGPHAGYRLMDAHGHVGGGGVSLQLRRRWSQGKRVKVMEAMRVDATGRRLRVFLHLEFTRWVEVSPDTITCAHHQANTSSSITSTRACLLLGHLPIYICMHTYTNFYIHITLYTLANLHLYKLYIWDFCLFWPFYIILSCFCSFLISNIWSYSCIFVLLLCDLQMAFLLFVIVCF